MVLMTFCSSMCLGKGSCTIKPSTSASSFRPRMQSSNCSSVASSSMRMRDDLKPHFSQAITLFFTYASEPPSCPTSTAARCGRFIPAAIIWSTSALISSLMAAAVIFPSISFIINELSCLIIVLAQNQGTKLLQKNQLPYHSSLFFQLQPCRHLFCLRRPVTCFVHAVPSRIASDSSH